MFLDITVVAAGDILIAELWYEGGAGLARESQVFSDWRNIFCISNCTAKQAKAAAPTHTLLLLCASAAAATPAGTIVVVFFLREARICDAEGYLKNVRVMQLVRQRTSYSLCLCFSLVRAQLTSIILACLR